MNRRKLLIVTAAAAALPAASTAVPTTATAAMAAVPKLQRDDDAELFRLLAEHERVTDELDDANVELERVANTRPENVQLNPAVQMRLDGKDVHDLNTEERIGLAIAMRELVDRNRTPEELKAPKQIEALRKELDELNEELNRRRTASDAWRTASGYNRASDRVNALSSVANKIELDIYLYKPLSIGGFAAKLEWHARGDDDPNDRPDEMVEERLDDATQTISKRLSADLAEILARQV